MIKRLLTCCTVFISLIAPFHLLAQSSTIETATDSTIQDILNKKSLEEKKLIVKNSIELLIESVYKPYGRSSDKVSDYQFSQFNIVAIKDTSITSSINFYLSSLTNQKIQFGEDLFYHHQFDSSEMKNVFSRTAQSLTLVVNSKKDISY